LRRPRYSCVEKRDPWNSRPVSLANANANEQVWTALDSRKFLETILHIRHCIPELVRFLIGSTPRLSELPQEGLE
jgi:hypothetical protein